MAAYRVQHTLQHPNGLSKDRYVNTFYFFKVTPPDEAALGALALAVKNFYTQDPPGSVEAVSAYMSGLADGANASVKIYYTGDAPPREPLYEEFYTPPAFGSSGGNLPSEVAVCLSYEADPVSGVPIGRRRGRLYIGPLSTRANAASAGIATEATVLTAFQETLTQSALMLHTALVGSGFSWVVHSEAGDADYEIKRVWVDNAFDVQRRRGIKPSSRTTLTL